ncbi:hypothetical protein KCMC57_up16250 [Kitasatospora sp. CMC57]|uniref:Histidine kinase/HSP90-like ATPase domain-containing protein n=1 Tax=Kitasatospora sp. CMC57 TaxID=3231513 RepID=A0AB33JQK4_9ACTN
MPADQTESPWDRWTVPPLPKAIGPTRARAASRLRQWAPDLPVEYADRVRQVVGELVANAVQHAGGPITVDLWITPLGHLAVLVTDPSPVPPTPREPYEDGARGRGLAVVTAECVAWTWQPVPGGGKAVSATIALPDTGPTAATASRTAPGRPFTRLRPAV